MGRKSGSDVIDRYGKILNENALRLWEFNALSEGLSRRIQVFQMAVALNKLIPKDKAIVVVGVGCFQIVGDMIGPVTARMLKTVTDSITIYGDWKEKINSSTVNGVSAMLCEKHPNDFVIAIDASAGTPGIVRLDNRPIRPASATGKNQGLADIGDIAICGMTNRTVDGLLHMGYEPAIVEIPRFIVDAIWSYLYFFRKEKRYKMDMENELSMLQKRRKEALRKGWKIR